MKFKQGLHVNQEVLFPKKVSDCLSQDHIAKVIIEVITKLDLSLIENKYSDQGQYAYNPKTMLALLFYGYSKGIRSSREISKGCVERLDFVFLADGLTPSHDRISDFRKDNFEEIKQFFCEIVLIGASLGLVKIGNINTSIDGTKIKANASAKLNKDEKGLQKLIVKVEEDIKNILQEAEEMDKKEDKKYGKRRGDELPKKLKEKKSREITIKEAIKKLKEQKEKRKNEIKKEKGREPTECELKKVEKMKMNVTDNEARFMKERCGVIKPNYNAQASVDEKEQFIVANDVVDECNDHHQLVPMVKKTVKNIKENPKKIKADNGYHHQLEEAVRLFRETDFYVDDVNRRNEELEWKEIKEKYSEIEMKNLRKLLTKKGEEEYRKRMHAIEPVFGNLKFNLGYRYFLVRGLKKVKGEFNLMCIGHNLGKIARFMKRKKIKVEKLGMIIDKQVNDNYLILGFYVSFRVVLQPVETYRKRRLSYEQISKYD